MEIARKIFNLLNLLVSLSAIGTLVWWHGYQYQPHHLHPHILYLNSCIGFYLLQFMFRAKLSGNIREYFHGNRLEYGLFAFLILEFITNWFLHFSMVSFLLSFTGIENHDHMFVLCLHILLLFIVGVELGKATARSTVWKLSPPILFILSFMVLIVIGSSLLMLPEMTANKQGMPYIDALFTSISANCVTGLIVVDTATYFSLKGKMLIMQLIQLGGLNIIGFATYFISFFRRSIEEQRHRVSIKELLHADNLSNTKQTVRLAVVTTLIIEFLGAIMLYQQWGVDFANERERFFYSVFHSVSAFNNAGFTLFTDGFTNAVVQNTYSLHITVALLIVFGGLGFTTLQETFGWSNISRLWGEKNNKLSIQTKIALYSSILLIVAGAFIFFALEQESILIGQSTTQSIIASIFQSITARTAGFNTVDFGSLGILSSSLIMILMFIGTSSGSTGGGIKTSTLTTLIFAVLKRKERATNYGKSFLTKILVQKAVTITIYSLIVITIGTVILFFSDADKECSDLLFEEISAFGTVGLSTGVTPHLSLIGKLVIMGSMFIGRIGPLALSITLLGSTTYAEDKEEQGIMIG